ncbi:MerR family transcriptional regulator [Alteribacter keqinensis]|uniref:MerR family transcriptional regulator n=1 Tax=Alteribacter keqinensis TaxID=2483800 RepID=A0A3M7TYH6_9BACI|nr:MerR family transcriptional regulator [Alteribacter keqinensis]
MYLIKEISGIAGVSVRTLHHYDHIGLLKPVEVKRNGYRYYNDESLERLQQILFFKELGFSLQKIKDILEGPGFDRKRALEQHKQVLMEKKKRLEKIIASVDQTVAAMEGEKGMSKKEMFEPFDTEEIEKHQKKYADETKAKYGHTDAYKESMKKTASYNKEDWAQIQTEWNEFYKKLASHMGKGPKDQEVQKLIGEYHQLINNHFYACPTEMFRGLGEMYVSDERFTKNIDKHGDGLAAFLKDAMGIYCDDWEGK